MKKEELEEFAELTYNSTYLQGKIAGLIEAYEIMNAYGHKKGISKLEELCKKIEAERIEAENKFNERVDKLK